MGKVIGSAKKAGFGVRKPAPGSGKVIRRTATGRDTPPHDPFPFKRGGPTVPKDKGWCRHCNAWRYYRNLHRVALENGDKAYQGVCIQCKTPHIFRPSGR